MDLQGENIVFVEVRFLSIDFLALVVDIFVSNLRVFFMNLFNLRSLSTVYFQQIYKIISMKHLAFRFEGKHFGSFVYRSDDDLYDPFGPSVCSHHHQVFEHKNTEPWSGSV